MSEVNPTAGRAEYFAQLHEKDPLAQVAPAEEPALPNYAPYPHTPERYQADVLRATAAWHYSQVVLYAEMATGHERIDPDDFTEHNAQRRVDCQRLSFFHERAWQDAESKLEALRG